MTDASSLTSASMNLSANPECDLRFVLVGTQHPGNLGAAARALKTMGFGKLTLVTPAQFPSEEARRRAAGAEDILEAAQVFDSLAAAVADCRYVLGCTARGRRVQLPEYDARQAGRQLLARAKNGPLALVFGRERTGLFNEELQCCHGAVLIPANPDYTSLNLAAAVQVLAYEARLAWLATASAPTVVEEEPRQATASQAQLEGFFTQLGQTLDDIDFHKGRSPDSAMRKLRRLFLRNSLTEAEVRLLRGILADAQRMAGIANGKSGRREAGNG
jgi:tRNA (cytidine32/uridine32-2'-O)-methyltransferase